MSYPEPEIDAARRNHSPEPAVAAVTEGISAIHLLNIGLRYRRLVLALAVLLGGAVALVTLGSPRSYRSTTSFAPQSRSTPSNLSGLAAQFGLSVPGGDRTQSPEFYADLLTSPELLREAVRARYEFADAGTTRGGTLVELYEAEGKSAAEREEAAMRELDRNVGVGVSAKTGVVTLAVTTESPELSREVAAKLVELLGAFNLETRQTQARAEREFTEQRLREVEAELRRAEGDLQNFLQRNRDYRNSPALQFAHERLARAVAMQQTLYTSIAQAHEQAKLEEVRDTPVLTTIAAPSVPVRPEPRGLVSRTVLAAIVGAMLGYLLGFARHALARTSQPARAEYEEFAALRREVRRDLRRPWRLLLPG